MHVRIFGPAGAANWGIGQDARLVESVVRGRNDRMRIEHCDPLTWGSTADKADVHIYLEQPCRLAVPWAGFNVVVVNPEWWARDAWNWCFLPVREGGMDMFVFKSDPAAALFPEVEAKRRFIIPWRTDMIMNHDGWAGREERFLYIVGSSQNKLAAARGVVAGWFMGWPPLEVWCTEAFAAELRPLIPEGAAVSFQTAYKSRAEKEARQMACKWHVVASAAEGFGYTMAEAAACGAPVVWTGLPTQEWTWRLGALGCIVSETVEDSQKFKTREGHVGFSGLALGAAVGQVMNFTPTDIASIQKHYRERRSWALREFLQGWRKLMDAARSRMHLPALPSPMKGTPPKVGIITVSRNRVAWWTNMVQNVSGQKWPSQLLEWIVVDEAGELEGKVVELREKVPQLVVRYVKGMGASVGAKRNMAVRAAGADVAVFMCMDDDDHYPPDSVARRILWMNRLSTDIVYCSALPMYDTTRYISAMNVPPLTLAPAERVSEATLAFRRSVWAAKPFPEVSVSEGEGFLTGRDAVSVEIPCYGVIVSFIHNGNTSSRRIPPDQEANGCHYGFSDEYFKYIHTVGELSR